MKKHEKQKHQDEAKSWQPYLTYTWPNATLRAWYEIHGSWAFYHGGMWEPKVKKLGVGMNEVRFRIRKIED